MTGSSRSERVVSPRRPNGAMLALPARVPARVTAIEAEQATELADEGLGVGSRVVVLNRAPFGGPLVVRCGRARLAIPRRVAAGVSVEPTVEPDPAPNLDRTASSAPEATTEAPP